MSFAQNDKVYQKYYDELIILLGTGLRISELCGLTDTDIDFENRIINVDHQLLRSAETGYYIETPKTKSGIRQIPMSEKVYEAFNRVLKRRRVQKLLLLTVTATSFSSTGTATRKQLPIMTVCLGACKEVQQVP